jgi:hypothetical protein
MFITWMRRIATIASGLTRFRRSKAHFVICTTLSENHTILARSLRGRIDTRSGKGFITFNACTIRAKSIASTFYTFQFAVITLNDLATIADVLMFCLNTFDARTIRTKSIPFARRHVNFSKRRIIRLARNNFAIDRTR